MTESLKRRIGLPLLVLYGLGTVVGVGIYAVIGEIAAEAGPFTPLSFAVAAILAGFTALSLGELSARYPESAGEAAYVSYAFGSKHLSALTGWMVILSGVVSAATIARGAVPYVQDFISLDDTLMVILFVVLLGCVASLGVRESATFAAGICVLEIVGLFVVIAAGWSSVETLNPFEATAGYSFSVTAMLSGALLAFYAFIGFEDMVNMAEEVKDPLRTMPRAILIVLVLSSILYIALAIVLVSAMDYEELQGSRTPLASVFEQTSGISGLLISGIGVLAIINGGLVQVIMVSRVIYGLARRAQLPSFFTHLNVRTHTPIRATFFAAFIVLVLAMVGSLTDLANATAMVLLVVFTLVNASLIRLKLVSSPPEGAPDHPMWIPVVGMVVSAGFVVWKIVELIKP